MTNKTTNLCAYGLQSLAVVFMLGTALFKESAGDRANVAAAPVTNNNLFVINHGPEQSARPGITLLTESPMITYNINKSK